MTQVFKITPNAITAEILESWIYPNLEQDLYWSDVWTPPFYVALAQAGFISICWEFEGTRLLLPQLQKAYAVLDWKNRPADGGVGRLLRSDRLRREGVALKMTSNTADVVAGIRRAYGSECWLLDEYCSLLRRLESRRSETFRLYGVELRSASGHLIGGELGYTIGATYTSLTGFLDRDRRWNNCGKLQLHMLAALLESCGYAFWNLGQPQMQYKLDLGARVTPREEFLQRWLNACAQKPARELEEVRDLLIPCVRSSD